MKRMIALVGFVSAMTALAAGQSQKDSVDQVQPLPMPLHGMPDLWKRFVYPEMAVEQKIQGTVYVKASVDEKGNVVAVKVMKGVHALLDSAAVRAVRDTPFSPGMHEGKAVKSEVTIPIKFELQGSEKSRQKSKGAGKR